MIKSAQARKSCLSKIVLLAAALLAYPHSSAADVNLIIDKGQQGTVTSLTWSPDNRIVVVGSDSRSGTNKARLTLWDVATACEVNAWPTTDHIAATAFSPDGLFVAAILNADTQSTIKVWAVPSGREARSFVVPGRAQSIAISPDSKFLAVGGNTEKRLNVWRLSTGEDFLPNPQSFGSSEALDGVVFTPEGTNLIGCGPNATHVWDAADGKLVRSIKSVTTGGVRSLTFGSDGKQLFKTAYDETVILDLENGAEVDRYRHKALDANASYSPAGWFAGAVLDGKLALWEARSGSTVRTLDGFADAVATESSARAKEGIGRSIAFDKFKKKVAVAAGSVIHVWDPAKGRDPLSLKVDHHVSSLRFSSDGEQLASAGLDGVLEIRDVAKDYKARRIEAHSDAIYSLAFSPDGKTVVSSSIDGEIKFWNSSTGQLLRQIPCKSRVVKYSPDGKLLAALMDDGTVTIYDAATAESNGKITPDAMRLHTFEFGSDGKSLFVGGNELKLRSAKNEKN
jgi:WD40 repeat protein